MAKKTNRVTVNLNDDLLAIMHEIMRRERYRSPSELFESCVRHWALSQQEHAITGGWASLPPEERDRIDAGLRALVESGNGKKGSWLKAEIYRCIEEINGEKARTPTVDQVLTRLPESVRKRLAGDK